MGLIVHEYALRRKSAGCSSLHHASVTPGLERNPGIVDVDVGQNVRLEPFHAVGSPIVGARIEQVHRDRFIRDDTNGALVERFTLSAILGDSGLPQQLVQLGVVKPTEIIRIRRLKVAKQELGVRIVHIHRNEKGLKRLLVIPGHQIGPSHGINLCVPAFGTKILFEEFSHLFRTRKLLGNYEPDFFLGWLPRHLQTRIGTNTETRQPRRYIAARRRSIRIEFFAKPFAIQVSLKEPTNFEIDDLLDISRIHAGKLKVEIQRIEPEKVITAAIESTRSLAASKSIQIETKVDPTVKYIFADPCRFQQILWNLITNAIKFSPQGGRIWISMDSIPSPEGERIRVQVRDNGKGIKQDFIPRIFERFTQVDSTSTRSYGGLGLGLAIVKKLVEMHEGTVAVESPGEGKGATFTVSLPAVSAAKIVTAEAEAEAEAEVSLRGLRVLVVDDEASAREVFSEMLQSFGAEVKTAGSVSDALTVFREFKPDVLVSDIAMPVEDGYSLIGKVRALKSKAGQTPALALTAYAGREDIQRTHLAGFQSHVAKPVDANKLALAIARLAGRK
jgi:CheY-like chemotaxis protein/two-component sensor histidine kinase